MLNLKSVQAKSQIIHRLARVEGQLRGVHKMIAEDRDCKDIVQQLIAIRSAVQSASLSFMQDVTTECLANLDHQGDPEAQRVAMSDLIKMLGKLSE